MPEHKANVLLIGTGGIGTISALNLQVGGKASVTAVLRSNFDHVKEHGFRIRSVDHGLVEGFRPEKSMCVYEYIIYANADMFAQS